MGRSGFVRPAPSQKLQPCRCLAAGGCFDLDYGFEVLPKRCRSKNVCVVVLSTRYLHDNGGAGTPTFQLGEEAPPSFLMLSRTGCRVIIQRSEEHTSELQSPCNL